MHENGSERTKHSLLSLCPACLVVINQRNLQSSRVFFTLSVLLQFLCSTLKLLCARARYKSQVSKEDLHIILLSPIKYLDSFNDNGALPGSLRKYFRYFCVHEFRFVHPFPPLQLCSLLIFNPRKTATLIPACKVSFELVLL